MDCEHLGVLWVLFDLRADAAGDAPAPLLPGPGRLAFVSARVGCADPGSGALRGRLTGQAVGSGREARPLWSAWEPALPLLGVQRRARPGHLCTRSRQRRLPGRSVGTARRPSGDTQLIGRATHPLGQNCLRGLRPDTPRHRGAAWEKPVAAGRVRVPSLETPRTDAGGKQAGGGRAAAAVRTGSSGAKAFCGGWAAARSARADSGQTSQRAARGTEPVVSASLRGLGQRPRAEPSFGPRWVSTGTPGRSPLRPGTGPLGTGASVSGGLAEAGGAWRGRRVLWPSGFWVVCAEPPVAALRRACTRPTRSRLTLHGRSPSAAGRAGVPVMARGRAPSPRAFTAPRQRPPEPRRARRQARQGRGGGGSRTGPRAPRGPPPPARPGPHHPGLARRGLERRVASLALLLVPLVAVGLRRGLREVVAVLGCWGWAAGGKWLQAFPGLTPPGLTPPGPQAACPSPLGT